MRKIILAMGLVAIVTGSSAIAAETAVVVQPSTCAATCSDPIRLDMPAVQSRRKMLFQFGLFGAGFHFGWKRKTDCRGVGSPILFTSVGQRTLGFGTR